MTPAQQERRRKIERIAAIAEEQGRLTARLEQLQDQRNALAYELQQED